MNQEHLELEVDIWVICVIQRESSTSSIFIPEKLPEDLTDPAGQGSDTNKIMLK